MSIYFAFSDESGSYKVNPGKKFINRTPFYVRATVLMDADEWNDLNKSFFKKKSILGSYISHVDLSKEIKWDYLWFIKNAQEKNLRIDRDKDYYFLSKVPFSKLLQFVNSELALFQNLKYIKIIVTITKNKQGNSFSIYNIYKMHIQDTLQRIEMEINRSKDNLCVLFIDSVSKKVDNLLRNAYNDIYNNGDFIENYQHVKDSLSIELSHQSIGVQLADYIAGIVNGTLRGFPNSKALYYKRVKMFIRKNQNTNDASGYGIIEIPKNPQMRSDLKKTL